MAKSAAANFLIFSALIVALFVVPVAMVASDLSTGHCDYSCARR